MLPDGAPSASGNDHRALAVLCPDWPVVACRRPVDDAVIVVHANRVIAASPAARAHGVHEGLRRREAQGRCPDVTVVERDLGAEARQFEVVVAALDGISPRVEITRPGSCVLATRGPSRYFRGDDALADRVLDAMGTVLGGRGPYRVGIADGPFTATIAARHAADRGSVVVPTAETAAFLAPMPVGVLDRPELADLLVRLGLSTLGAIAALPVADLVGRFGAEGAVVHRLASGRDERPLDAGDPPAELEVVAELDPPVERVDQAAFVAKSLADELERRLLDIGAACTRVLISAETETGEELARLWRHEGALGPHAVAERVRWQLDGWLNGAPATRPSGGLIRLALRPDEITPGRGRQLGFWGGHTAAAEHASRAVARVQGLLGPDGVSVPERRGGRDPIEQLALVPVDAGTLVEGRQPVDTARAAAPWPGRVPSPSPAVVHHQRRSAEVVDDQRRAVTVSGRGEISAPPRWLAISGPESGRGPWAEVTAWAGPWPVDERWWDPERHRRRARFQLVTAGGQAHLVALEGQQWWVEATYD